jgi:hypothetical protein
MTFVNIACRRLWLADLSRRSAATLAELENTPNALAELANIRLLTVAETQRMTELAILPRRHTWRALRLISH